MMLPLTTMMTLRFKQLELDIDTSVSPHKIGRFALDYDLIIDGVVTSKTIAVSPDRVQEFHLWEAIRELLRPLLAAEGVTPPPRPRPIRDGRPPSIANLIADLSGSDAQAPQAPIPLDPPPAG